MPGPANDNYVEDDEPVLEEISGLIVNWDDGEGKIELPAKFQAELPIFRADVLSDWISLLEEKYKRAVREL